MFQIAGELCVCHQLEIGREGRVVGGRGIEGVAGEGGGGGREGVV